MLLRDHIKRASISFPEKLAFVDGARSRNWLEMDVRSSALAAGLQAIGVKKGDVVGILSHEHLEVFEHWFACLKLGAVRTGINWRYSEREMAHIIRDSNARAIVVQANCVDLLGDCLESFEKEGRLFIGYGGTHALKIDYEELMNSGREFAAPELGGDDLVGLGYTTGTTGLPKGALWTQARLREGLMHIALNLGLRHEDRWFMPACTAGAPIFLNSLGLVTGLTTVQPNGDFDIGKTVDFIQRHKITNILLVPTMWRRFLDYIRGKDIDLSSVRQVLYGSSPMPPRQVRELAEVVSCEFIQAYGMTETGGWVTYLRDGDHRRALSGEEHLLSSCGRPSMEAEVEIRTETGERVPRGDLGEVWVRAPSIMVGYHHQVEATKESLVDGWLRTHDMGRMDDDGYLYLMDRRHFMIISGAFNVYPVVVENVITEHPAIKEVAVVGAPHPEWGEAVVAIVSLRPGTALGEDELIEFCRPRLAKWEVPKHVQIIQELPHGSVGKIDKKVLRNQLREKPELLPWAM